ncbi:MAG: Rpn family recombination-promoting nuclease/putative transposase, partial [Lachnospiraceae bacterium]|nr:Rpn family recombination-promoting nuclease/putative transposase [Lachnospiraceae bacterium]
MNDYMFRAVLQENNIVLRGLICSLLHLSEEEVISVEITNPIILGESIYNKEFRLDINVCLNDHTLINLEMQVDDRMDWQNRSLLYLCRSYDQLDHGQEYMEIQPVIHIGFLDYTLFDESPEFYATYKLINVKNHKLYNDNFTLRVVNLSRIDLATDEDKLYLIDHWARLFKATTWEEIHMLASDNNHIAEASKTMFKLSAEENIRKRCLDREEYYREIRTYKKIIAEDKACIAEKDARIAEMDTMLQALSAELEKLKADGIDLCR